MKVLNKIIVNPLIVGDLHFCEFSSILRKKHLRLNGLLATLTWIIDTAKNNSCDSIIFLGDFFDKPELNAEELTALSCVYWPEYINYYCLVGNHELAIGNCSCSSTHILKQINNFEVIDQPAIVEGINFDYFFLPYVVDNENRKLDLYLKEYKENKDLIILSHNDIEGIQMGSFISKEGFNINDIENHCALFINGHLHNGQNIGSKIINLGNITGQNFSEDASKYNHNALMIQTSYDQAPIFTTINNPQAFNFYKVDLTTRESSNLFENFILFPHAVLSVRCYQKDIAAVRDFLSKLQEVEEFRIISVPEPLAEASQSIETLTETDHIEKFKQYVIEQLGLSEYVMKELQEIS